MILRAITLWEPWLQAILDGHKPVENRTWEPADSLLAQGPLVLALHASARWDRDGAAYCQQMGHAYHREDVARRAGHVRALAVVESVTPVPGEGDPRASGWAFGPWCWWLRHVTGVADLVLPPIRGWQGLWTLPEPHRSVLTPLAEHLASMPHAAPGA